MSAYSYVIDTSSIFEWYVRRYPPDIFTKLPERMEELIADGRLASPLAVRDEIKEGDNCYKWIKAHPELFVEEDEPTQLAVKKLMREHHDPGKPQKGILGADPFVIGLAIVWGSPWCVVCDENAGTAENRKIPFVSKASGVTCINFQEMMRQERWTFA